MDKKELIKKIILDNVDNRKYQIFLFGSRARGDFKNNSDYDIGIYGSEKIELKVYLKLIILFEDLPVNVDIIDFQDVDNEFKNLVFNNEKIEIWNNPKN